MLSVLITPALVQSGRCGRAGMLGGVELLGCQTWLMLGEYGIVDDDGRYCSVGS